MSDMNDVTVLPDGSAFGVLSFPLPEDHWLYAPPCEEWDAERDTSADTPRPIVSNEQREAVKAAIRWAVRGATMNGREMDFDPDALVLNAAYALCGPCVPTVTANAAITGAEVDNCATGGEMTPEQRIDAALDSVLKASGSALRHYTMPKTLADMREAMRKAMFDEYIRGLNDNVEAIKKAGNDAQWPEPVGWMTPGGDISRSLKWCTERCLPNDYRLEALYTRAQVEVMVCAQEARRVEMLRKLGARLAGLLDEDQFAECEALLLAAGVMPEEKDNVACA